MDNSNYKHNSINIDIVECSKTRNVINDLLNILSIVSIFLGMVLAAYKMSKIDSICSVDASFHFIESLNVFTYLLFIPLINLANGVILKRKNMDKKLNGVKGMVISILFLIISFARLNELKTYSNDKNYISDLEAEIGDYFSDEFQILVKKGDARSDDFIFESQSVVVLTYRNDASFDYCWTNEFNAANELPQFIVLETTGYEKFLVYCYETKEYNPNNINSEYHYVAIAYDLDYCNYVIYKFHIK